MKKRVLLGALGVMISLPGAYGMAQAPATTTGTPASPAQSAPKPPADPFPPVNPKNFTAQSPTLETVNSFLRSLWGIDDNRTWSVSSIQPTNAPGVVRIQVYVAEKTQPTRVGQTVFYVTPDGKHLIAGDMVNFAAQPFAEARAILQQRANGPARGAAGKDLELVEFADLQCPNCKSAQSTIDQVMQDFPQARVVFEDYPQTSHPFALQAAAVGHCVRQAKGDAAFFKYAGKVYDTQADLTKAKVDATLRAAVTEAGADPNAVMTCSNLPATQDAVNAVLQLGMDIGVTVTPTLVVNGRLLPISQIPYDTLKRVIVFQGSLDGVTVKEQPSLKTLK